MDAAFLGALGGAGVLCLYYGLARLRDQARSDAERRRGWWPFNLGLLLIAVSVYVFTQAS